MKHCSRCEITKPKTEFYRHKTTADKLGSMCKLCSQELVTTYYTGRLGVYGIFDEDGVCLYIGQSKRVRERIDKHKYCLRHPEKAIQYWPSVAHLYPLLLQHKGINFQILEDTRRHQEKEIDYINQYQPLYNRNTPRK